MTVTFQVQRTAVSHWDKPNTCIIYNVTQSEMLPEVITRPDGCQVALTSLGCWLGSGRWDHACTLYCGQLGRQCFPTDVASSSSVFDANDKNTGNWKQVIQTTQQQSYPGFLSQLSQCLPVWCVWQKEINCHFQVHMGDEVQFAHGSLLAPVLFSLSGSHLPAILISRFIYTDNIYCTFLRKHLLS